jgi:hypothetical protein
MDDDLADCANQSRSSSSAALRPALQVGLLREDE